jgi:UDP-glucose 4-epimerase
MDVLVTGATGFLGRHLVPVLAQWATVHGLRRTASHGDPEPVRWLRADLSRPLDPAILPRRIDAVVHLAQSARHAHFPHGAEDVFQVNVASTSALLEYALGAGCRVFLLASTGSVYEPYRGPLSEAASLRPASWYPASKLAAETLLPPYAPHLSACALRLFFPYGPGQRGRLVPNIVALVRQGGLVRLAGRGEGLLLTPTYVEDVVDVVCTAVRERWSGVVNVASPETTSVRALADEVGRLVGRRPCFVHADHPDGEEPAPIVPRLDVLADRYDLARFTPLHRGVAAVVGAASPNPVMS